MFRLLSIAFVISLVTGLNPAMAQTPAPAAAPAAPARPAAPIRDPHTAGYVAAKELRDGTNPAPTADGNFIIGATHPAAPEMTAKEDVPQGTSYNFTMESTDSRFYSGGARETPPAGHFPRRSEGDQQPSDALHAQSDGLCAQTICPWCRRAVAG